MHLSFNELLYGLQSGFQRRHSTETALVRILDQIHFNLDKNNITSLLCIDYSKAINLINHEILLIKLKAFGVIDNNLSLFHSYLSDRRQYVFVSGCKLSLSSIRYRVPQGVYLVRCCLLHLLMTCLQLYFTQQWILMQTILHSLLVLIVCKV